MKLIRIWVACLTVLLSLFLIASPALAAGELIKSDVNPVVWSEPITWPFEAQAVGAPCVIFDGGVYKMWYSGVDLSTFPSIGYAESNDGLSWVKWGPVLEKGIPSAWDSDGVGGACVINDGGTYKMWYTGLKGLVPAIGYAESPDGTNWTKIGVAAVMTKGGLSSDWDSDGVAFPSVIKDGVYKMWFTGRKNTGGLSGTLAIGYADSVNGTTWTKHVASNPVLEKSLSGWDNRGVGACTVKKIGSTYSMYYTGFAASGGVFSRIGHITSTDEVTWVNGASPVLDAGDPGDWDEKGVAAPTFILKGGNIELWYTGANTLNQEEGFLQIGQAHTENPGVPAGSTLSMLILIGGFAVLICGASVWGLRRNRG